MQVLKIILRIISNKYLVALLVFALFMLFFDRNDIFVQKERKRQLHELQASKAFYEKEIAKTKKDLADIQNNPAALEKYAREHFYLKRDNEDIFLLEDDTDSTLQPIIEK